MSIDKKIFEDVKGVLFDLDGTLVDTLPGLAQLVNQMRQDFDKPPLSEEKVGLYIGKGMMNLIHRTMTDSMDGKVLDNIFNLAVHSMSKHIEAGKYDKGVLFPGVKEALSKLKERGYKLAIVTNKPFEMSKETIKSCGLEGVFDVVVGGDSASRPKPAKEPIDMACQMLGLSAKEVIMIGDSGNDSAAAKAADVRSLLVETGWSEGVPLSEIAKRDDAVGIYKNIPEIVDALLSA